MKSVFKRLLARLRSAVCRHRFRLADLTLTGIPIPPVPDRSSTYSACLEYFLELPRHPSHTHRVKCTCAKCGAVFFAHCGLDLVSKHGDFA